MPEFVSELGSEFASEFCRDQDDLVTLEAVKALFGQLPPYNPSVMTGATVQSPQEELVSNRMRIRAWSMVASQVLPFTFGTLGCSPSYGILKGYNNDAPSGDNHVPFGNTIREQKGRCT